MKFVNQVLREKGTDVWTVTPDTPIYEALELMAEKNIGAVLVVEAGRLEGVFSERDYARKVVLHGRSSRDTLVKETMTSVIAYVGPGQSIDECMSVMTHKRCRHLPVLEDDRLVGLISIGDVVKSIITDLEFTVNQLENYITGRV